VIKFSSKLSEEALEGLRAYAGERDRPFAHVLDEAVREYLARVQLRPAFDAAARAVLEQHAALLEELS
jgi:nucleotide-binding universal stress UspA family protein